MPLDKEDFIITISFPTQPTEKEKEAIAKAIQLCLTLRLLDDADRFASSSLPMREAFYRLCEAKGWETKPRGNE